MHARSSGVSYYFVLLRHKKPTSVIEVFLPCVSTNITDNSIGVKEKIIAVRCDVHVLLAYNTAPIYSSVAAVIYSVTAVFQPSYTV
jgi:pyruvate/2-oxoacid:ferredoxin oxidoreductase beta subunit